MNLKAILGFNSNRREYDRNGVESTNQVVFGVLRHFNFTQQSTVNSYSGIPFQARSEQNIYGLFADVTLDMKIIYILTFKEEMTGHLH